MKKKRIKILIAISFFLLCFSLPALAAEDIMPLADVKAGMTGYGKTVFKGTKIEKFPIEVISIMNDRSLDQDLILIKLTGKEVEEYGGIAAGMSGSPIYINDRLIGAIGYGWSNSDHRYGLVTPIERMLKLIDSDRLNSQTNVGQRPAEVNDFAPEENFIKTTTPLMVSGLSGRALKQLKSRLTNYKLDVIPSPGIEESDKSNARPRPGEAIAVQLVRGDISIASIGTLTYIDKDNILAFGHPFTNRGKVSYLLSRAKINAVIPSTEQPFKLGSPYNRLLGSITEDRGAGIAGKIDTYPRITPLYVAVYEDGKLIKEVSLQIINDEHLFDSLANTAALQAVDSALDRIGPGSAHSKLKIMGRGLPELQVESDNMYYSQNDIGSMALTDFSQLLNLILTNPYKEINLIDIRLELDFSKKDSVALVQEAKVLNDQIHPGDELEVEVKLHKYRDGIEKKIVKLKIPEDIEPGMATLFIDGGYTGETNRSQLPEELPENNSNGDGLKEAKIAGHKTFESMLEAYLDSADNNDLILQLYPAYSAPPAYEESSAESPTERFKNQKEDPKSKDEQQAKNELEQEAAADNAAEQEIKERFTTDYVLEGNLNLNLEIIQPDADVVNSTATEAETAQSSDNLKQPKPKDKKETALERDSNQDTEKENNESK